VKTAEQAAPRKVVLVGNPNVGKSLIFSRITGVGVISANYPGTTVDVKIGRFRFRDLDYELYDIPGVYSLEAYSTADEAALRLADAGDIIINIVDATSLERNLYLTLQLLGKHKPTIVCLNLWDDTAHRGVAIDAVVLERLLGVPVVTTSALSGEGIHHLVAALERAAEGSLRPIRAADLWKHIGVIVGQVQKLSHRHHTLAERISDFTIHPVGGLVSAVAVLAAVFMLVRLMGEGLVNGVCGPLFTRFYNPFIIALSAGIPSDIIRGLLVGHSVDPLQSFGILTTGVYIALVLVFPYFLCFYLLFGVLEDSGYLPRLAVVLDTFFHRIGLHGYSSIPVMLGLGCKVPALLATRVLTNRREKILTMALILMSAPCLPQSAMIVSLGMRYGVATVLGIFGLLLAAALGMNSIMNRFGTGESPELFIEIPPYRALNVSVLAGKLWTRIVDYVREVFPMIVAGVVFIHVLESLKVIDAISNVVGKPITFLLGLPHDIAPVMILGFLRKDVSIALLAPFNLSAAQFVVASVFMVLYVPCVAASFTLVKELGVTSTLKIVGVVFLTAVTIASFLHVFFVLVDRVGGLF
jgi:ferrous iron transport protein B